MQHVGNVSYQRPDGRYAVLSTQRRAIVSEALPLQLSLKAFLTAF